MMRPPRGITLVNLARCSGTRHPLNSNSCQHTEEEASMLTGKTVNEQHILAEATGLMSSR